jgi:glycosyltransferase involved in cell wall biosynthesis
MPEKEVITQSPGETVSRSASSECSPAKVMFVVARLSIGGAERQLVELIKGIDRTQFDPCLVSLDRSGGFAQVIERLGVPIFYAERKYRFDPFVALRLVRLINRQRVSLLHSFLSTAGVYGSVAARIAGIPIVNSAIRASRYPTAYERLFLKPSFALSQVVTANSEAGRRVFSKLAPHNIRVVHNGVDMTRFSRLSDVKQKKASLGFAQFAHVVTLVARMSPEKNPMMFLRAAGIVLKQEPNTAFLLVGSGSLKEELELEIRRAGLGNNVFMMGECTNVEEILQITDVGALTSNTEGLPNAIIEMLASGVPVVATDCGGTTEVLEDMRTGFCVERNDENRMARRMVELLRDQGLRKAMGMRGIEAIQEKFSIHGMVETTQSIYRELLR